jgi:uncharacterized protein (UPF0333 family)
LSYTKYMKTSRVLLAIVIILLVTAGGYYYSRNEQVDTSPTAEVAQVPEKITWSYEDMGTNEETLVPSTKVTVTV